MSTNAEEVILVNEQDEELGCMEKMLAHQEAKLHRAFSVFLFNSENKLLLQKRATGKYHSPSLWTNTCCSHPRPGENTKDAAQRRLKEEMGIDCQLEHSFSFIYKADMGNGLTEYEFDHIYFGTYNDAPDINKDEVADWKYSGIDEISRELLDESSYYTIWFKLVFEKVKSLKSA